MKSCGRFPALWNYSVLIVNSWQTLRSWQDTLDDAEILEKLKELNKSKAK